MPQHEDHSPLVLREGVGHVAEIVLHRPHALNALSTQLMIELRQVCDAVRADPDVRAVVLSGSGSRAFCVGADLKERNGFSEKDLLAQRPIFRDAFAAVRAIEVPVVAAVHGYALGGGLELALSCDLIVVDDRTIVGLPEVTVGLVPGGGGTQLLSRRAGLATALDLVLSGRRIDAPEALRLRVVDRQVGEGQAHDEARAIAATCAAASPTAVRAAKHAVRTGLSLPLDDALVREDDAWRTAVASPDRVEGIAAFNERRAPVWKAPTSGQ
jgi:enoyl-CoA hydratase/carnithine racemase